ncbi:hypothetical protein C8R43DRAFT_1152830 [Mycena crocata]|nr:hypothetical protein C8R43DRAFT_1152830 [Mycena crocata]
MSSVKKISNEASSCGGWREKGKVHLELWFPELPRFSMRLEVNPSRNEAKRAPFREEGRFNASKEKGKKHESKQPAVTVIRGVGKEPVALPRGRLRRLELLRREIDGEISTRRPAAKKGSGQGSAGSEREGEAKAESWSQNAKAPSQLYPTGARAHPSWLAPAAPADFPTQELKWKGKEKGRKKERRRIRRKAREVQPPSAATISQGTPASRRAVEPPMRKLCPKRPMSPAFSQMLATLLKNQVFVMGDQFPVLDSKAKRGASGGTVALTRRWLAKALLGQSSSSRSVRVIVGGAAITRGFGPRNGDGSGGRRGARSDACVLDTAGNHRVFGSLLVGACMSSYAHAQDQKDHENARSRAMSMISTRAHSDWLPPGGNGWETIQNDKWHTEKLVLALFKPIDEQNKKQNLADASFTSHHKIKRSRAKCHFADDVIFWVVLRERGDGDFAEASAAPESSCGGGPDGCVEETAGSVETGVESPHVLLGDWTSLITLESGALLVR